MEVLSAECEGLRWSGALAPFFDRSQGRETLCHSEGGQTVTAFAAMVAV